MPKARSDSDMPPLSTENADEVGMCVEVRRLSRILALMAVKGLQQNEQISFLSNAGYQPGEIAEMVRTTPGTVSQTLYSMRKGRSRKKRSEMK